MYVNVTLVRYIYLRSGRRFASIQSSAAVSGPRTSLFPLAVVPHLLSVIRVLSEQTVCRKKTSLQRRCNRTVLHVLTFPSQWRLIVNLKRASVKRIFEGAVLISEQEEWL